MPKSARSVVVFLGCVFALLPRLSAEILIPGGSQATWSFHDDGMPTGPNWMKPAFDDSKWRRGLGPFGFGEEGITTIVSSGDSDDSVTTTTYFRTTFHVSNPHSFTTLLMTTRVDDGYVAYLNGQEFHRWNMPQTGVTRQSYATERREGLLEQLHERFVLPSNGLVEGRNVLAIELHQASRVSSDLYLDLTLTGLSTSAENRPLVSKDAIDITRRYSDFHSLGPEDRIPDGFRDGGRSMQIDEFGFVVAAREILSVDRQNDDRLKRHLRFARSDELQSLNEIDRATRIARYVDQVFTPPEGRGGCETRSRNYLNAPFRSKEILLGNVQLICGAGVCRHRALLFKLMADDAKLNVSLIRGNYGVTESNVSGHAWNEMVLRDGKRVVVDVMNPQPDYYFPEVGESSLRGYRTVANQPKYLRPRQGPAAK